VRIPEVDFILKFCFKCKVSDSLPIMHSVGSADIAKKPRTFVLMHIVTIQYCAKWTFVSVLTAWFLFNSEARTTDTIQVDVVVMLNLNLG
jgi:hypothetical protein